MITLTPDQWLTNLLERPVFRAALTPSTESAAGTRAPECSALAELPAGSFVYGKIESAHNTELRRLEQVGFQVAESTVTLEVHTPTWSPPAASDLRVREAVPSDCTAVLSIAAAAFTNSRFHRDPLLAPFAGRVKAAWAENFFRGKRGERMVVAEQNGAVVGFNQLLYPAHDRAVIDLIAVAHTARGAGVGAALITALTKPTVPRTVQVGTQGHNIASVRLYEKLGFRLASAGYTLHYHHNPR
jgi:ribosomal protein S18 acetylase RimI-like enzyme